MNKNIVIGGWGVGRGGALLKSGKKKKKKDNEIHAICWLLYF